MRIKGNGYCLTSAKGHLDFYFKTFFFSEFIWLFEINFHMKPFGKNQCKQILNELGHMTKMAAKPIYGKTLKNLLLNQLTDDLEPWYVASNTRVPPR